MANAGAGTIVVGSPQNISGVLFQQSNPQTPLFNMLKTYTTNHRRYIMGAQYALQNPSAVNVSEDASMVAPPPKKTTFTNNENITQIFQRSVQETYRSMGNQGELTSLQPAFEGATNNRPNKLQTEKAIQITEMRRDIEWAILNNKYHMGTNTEDADSTQGLIEAITTNAIDAAGGVFSYDMICDMGEALTQEFPDGLDRVTTLIDATTARQLSSFISGSEKFVSSQTQLGANAIEVLTPFGIAKFLRLSNLFLPAGTAVFADANAMAHVIQSIPNKGFFFYEPLAKVGASEQGQIYGEWGLDYGVEWVHGKIENISTATVAASGGIATYVTNASDFGTP